MEGVSHPQVLKTSNIFQDLRIKTLLGNDSLLNPNRHRFHLIYLHS